MQRPFACPEDVRVRIAALRVPADEVTGTRIATNWRSGPPGHASAGAGGGGGYHGRGYGGHGGGGGGGYRRREEGGWGRGGGGHGGGASHGGGGGSGGGHGVMSGGGRWAGPPRRPIQDAPRFGNKARKDVTTEERMMDRIRDKMNKFSPMTYEATKTWLSQLLDSGETDFLTDFITLVFEKAAAESSFCALYAKLLTELRADFPHLAVEMRSIFDHFMAIFAHAAEEPDVGSAEYADYLRLRERRKFRRGYSAFLGETARLGVLTADDILRTANIILDALMTARVTTDKGQLCEEYADCLSTLMKSCDALVRPSVGPVIERVRTAMARDGAPSLTNKARFGLMDITDLF
jgi:hypothetical protein